MSDDIKAISPEGMAICKHQRYWFQCQDCQSVSTPPQQTPQNMRERMESITGIPYEEDNQFKPNGGLPTPQNIDWEKFIDGYEKEVPDKRNKSGIGKRFVYTDIGCCGGDYCDGDHNKRLKSFIRSKKKEWQDEAVREMVSRLTALGAAGYSDIDGNTLRKAISIIRDI